MSELAETYRDMRNFKKELRAMYGKPCLECQRLLPKANPSILLPQQRCRIHKYVDSRPGLTQSDYDAVGDKSHLQATVGKGENNAR